MIHQFIFAGPKPGLSASAFQSYWLNFHAVDYAMKIPQILKYLVTPRTTMTYKYEVPFFQGVAEIWLANDQQQLASLQSKEFLSGARADEPRWAAFWRTVVVDTESIVINENTAAVERQNQGKLYTLLKRREGSSLKDFQSQMLERHAPIVQGGIKPSGYIIGFSRPASYELGEPLFDAVEVWVFPTIDEVADRLNTAEMKPIEDNWQAVANPKYIFTIGGEEHWFIRPGERK